MGIFRTSSPEVASQVTLRELLWRGGVEVGVGASRDTDFCNKGQVVWPSRVLSGIKENQTSQVKEFSAFLCMGRCKSLGLLKSFLWYAPQLSGTSILCFYIPVFLRAHHRKWLLAARWQDFSFLTFLGLTNSPSVVAAIADDCDILVLWYGRKYSISHHHSYLTDVETKAQKD